MITVPPGETFQYTVVLDVKKPGDFEVGLRIFLEDHGIRTVDINVRVKAE